MPGCIEPPSFGHYIRRSTYLIPLDQKHIVHDHSICDESDNISLIEAKLVRYRQPGEMEYAMSDNTVQIRLSQSYCQTIGDISRIIGLMSPRFLVGLIDILDLEANPRNSKLGNVTAAIQDSIINDEDADANRKLFPLKSKGILIGSSNYIKSDNNHFALTFVDRSTEGILDGGHNTIAIGAYILKQAAAATGNKAPSQRDMGIWEDFKSTWRERRGQISEYLSMLRDDQKTVTENGGRILDFQIPVELIVPSNPSDPLCVSRFHSSLLEICDARNNNAQLTQGTKGNQEGLFDSFRALFEEKDPNFSSQISWKTNDGGRVDSRTLIALAWIPLSKTQWVYDGENKITDAPAPVLTYSSKEKCLTKYLELMRDERVSSSFGVKRELHDSQVLSALKLATDLPYLFDAIYRCFPSYYNQSGGSYGRISAIKSAQKKGGIYWTPFMRQQVDQPVPDGFIYPLAYGLRAIIEYDSNANRVKWKFNPYNFIQSNAFKAAVIKYCGVISQSDYDPQKVGKGNFSYTSAEDSIKLATIDYVDSEPTTLW